MATPKPGKMHSPVEHQATVDKGLKMKIKRTKPGTKHEIVKSGENGEKKRGSSGHTKDKKHGEKPPNKVMSGFRAVERVVAPVGPGPPPKEKRTDETPPSLNSSVNNNSNSSVSSSSSGNSSSAPPPLVSSPSPAPPSLVPQVPQPPVLEEPSLPPAGSPPPPTIPLVKEMVDVCVGTSVGTITEPDCLGPCEPGTSVTLEGIVWHETEGVLVVNVTWRGKTYIGTLLDCTKHEWAPPRFSDSPTSDLDVRTPRSRGKRGRSAGTSLANDLANFTETRSSVYSKLRNSNAAGAKGKRGPGASSPTPFASPKNDVTPNKRKNKSEGEEPSVKRKTTPSSPLPPPILLECPESNCSKKFKDANGLKYHQSHAHGMQDDDETKSESSEEEQDTSINIDVKKEDTSSENLLSNLEDNQQKPEEKSDLGLPASNPLNNEDSSSNQPPIIPGAPGSPSATDNALNIPSQPPTLTKVIPFKVKPSSSLMEDKSTPPVLPIPVTASSPQNPKKKHRKSPSASPHPSPLKSPSLDAETSGQEGVPSHAYSDISDDDAPLLESEVENKPKNADDLKGCQSPQIQPYGMYPYYGQPPYLVPSVSEKAKDTPSLKVENKAQDEDKKEGEFHMQKMLSQSYFQDEYPVQGYTFNMDGYPVPKTDKPGQSSADSKPVPSSALHIPSNLKLKAPEPSLSKEKHQTENHQLTKENVEKSQLSNPFLYTRPQQSQEDLRQFYSYPERKESLSSKSSSQKSHSTQSPRQKEKSDDKKERGEDKKQEGIKPTMETQGPPPPPTSQYAYIHPGYMQSPHYGTLPYDPSHPMYRAMNPMLVSGYSNSPYLHHQLHPVPRYAPEDLSQGQGSKALDLLQHHANQYYSHPQHKIHELQERAIKSPIPKVSTAISTPSSSSTTSVPIKPSINPQGPGKSVLADNKDSRSPPPQRHIHTHHHTHVGLGYPILASQYPTPYGTDDIRIPGAKFVSPVVKKEP